MSAPMEFPLIYKLSMQDRGVKTGLQGIHQTLQKGGVATEAASKKMAHLETTISSQNRAIGLANTLWTTSHANLMSVGQALGAVGSMGTQLVSIFTMLNTQHSMMGDKRKALIEATEELERAERATLNALHEHGEGSKEHVEALESENEVKSRIVDLNDDMVDAQKNVNAQNVAAGMSLMGTVAQGITLISVLGMMKTRGALTGATMIGLGGALGGLVLGVGLASASLVTGAIAAVDYRDEFGKWPTTLEEARTVTTNFGDSIPLIGDALDEFNAHMIMGISQVGEWGEGFDQWGRKVDNAISEAWAGFVIFTSDWASGVGKWIADTAKWLWDGAVGIIEGIAEWFAGIWDAFMTFTTDWAIGVEEWIADTAKWLWDGAVGIIEGIAEWFAGIWDAFMTFTTDWAIGVEEWIADTAKWLWDGGIGIMDSLAGALREGIQFIFDLLPDWGVNIVRSLADGITAGISLVIDAARAVASAITDILGITSPAQKGPLMDLMDWSPNLVKSYAEGIRNSIPLVVAASREMSASIDTSVNSWGGSPVGVSKGNWSQTSSTKTYVFNVYPKSGDTREVARELYNEFRRLSE